MNRPIYPKMVYTTETDQEVPLTDRQIKAVKWYLGQKKEAELSEATQEGADWIKQNSQQWEAEQYESLLQCPHAREKIHEIEAAYTSPNMQWQDLLKQRQNERETAIKFR